MAETPRDASAEISASASSATLLRDRFAVFPDRPLPDFDSPTARAFVAEDRRNPSTPLFALICSPGLAARISTMIQLKGLDTSGLLPMIEYGPAYWPPSNENVMIVVYERPLGGRAMTAITQGKTKISEYELPRRVITPISGALTTLASFHVSHRAIRPENLFFMDEEYQNLVIGDCVTAPPGYDQPLIYETIERGMASQTGRGLGHSADDIYALGATLIVLLLGYNPVARLTDRELFTAKVEQGSYAALCGGQRLPLSLLEPLRGMLADTEDDRWEYEQISDWMGGKKSTPVQKSPQAKSELPFVFEDDEYVTARMLAYGFAVKPDEAAKALRTEGLFDTFIRRGLNNADLADRIQIVIDQCRVNEKSPAGSDDVLISRICMILDPDGPIRYKGLAFMADGYGALLASELMMTGSAQIPAEALMRDLHDYWFSFQNKADGAKVSQHRTLVVSKGHLKIQEPGHGLERCLYELNMGLPCQSPLLVREYVLDPKDLLIALDKAAHDTDSKVRPVDRHIAAFIAARFTEDTQPHLRAFASPKEETSVIGMLSLLAFLQWKLKTERLYGLSSWVGGLLGPAINTYHSRTTRKTIERDIPKIVRKGSLPELFDLIDNADQRRVDADGFAEAQDEWQIAQDEVYSIEGDSGDRMQNVMKKGQQFAAMASVMMSMAIVSIIFLLEAW